MRHPLFACALAAAISATALTPSSTTLALGNHPLSSGTGGNTAAATEALLVQTLQAIASTQFDIALTEIDKVLQQNPNFRLAHLIRGDLLMARARPISSIGSAKTTRNTLQQSIENWRRDWESRDSGQYLRHYSADFAAGKQDLAAWAAQKRSVNAGKSWIKVKVDHVSMFLYPGDENLAVVTFEQDYTSSNTSSKMRKRQYWQHAKGGWRIVYEGVA